MVPGGVGRVSTGITWPPAGGLSTRLNEEPGMCRGNWENNKEGDGSAETVQKEFVRRGGLGTGR